MVKLFVRKDRTKVNSSLLKSMYRLRRADNRGTSLIEIIVALLILVLIFTPAYMAFSAALKLNQASKDKLYAENIAKNAMEIIKYTMDTGGSVRAVDFSALGGSAVASGGAIVTPSAISGSAVTYTFSGCPEGTSSYDVTINIDDHEGEARQHDFADMSAFNSTATALINPSGIAGGFDSSVVDYFYTIHTNYYNSLFQDALADINEHNRLLLEDYDTQKLIADLSGVDPSDPSYPQRPDYEVGYGHDPNKLWNPPAGMATLTQNDIMNRLSKQMEVEIEYIDVDAEGIARNKYELDSVMNYRINNSYNGATGVIDAVNYAKLPMKCDKYCDNVRYDDINNLYIMYTPMCPASESSITLDNEVINITNKNTAHTTTDPINVFIIMQAPEGRPLVKDGNPNGLIVSVSAIGSARPLNVFCNVNYTLRGGGNATQAARAVGTDKYTLIDEDKKMEVIYDVDIDVKETGTEGKTIHLTSTVSKN
jgi:Tfp pilus assembly protein PilV